MLKALLQRPISVLMFFLALLIIGVLTYRSLPVSLLPDIAIPEITVQVSAEGISARELENTAIKPLRSYLTQVGKLRSLNSETRNGLSVLRLKLDYGTNTDLSFIEVNEKIDIAMNYLPRTISRPRVIKASATDLPVFYLNLKLKSDRDNGTDERFLMLSELASNVIKRRIEQLPEVAIADITGLMTQQVQIVPDLGLLESSGLNITDIENILSVNNVEPGNMTVKDGQFEYNIKFSSLLRTVDDVRNIVFKTEDRILKLKDLAKVELVKREETGLSLVDEQRAITIGIVKQGDATIEHLRESLNGAIQDLEKNHQDIKFIINRNQTELLDLTIDNLRQNLLIGFSLVSVVALLFLGSARSPIVIGISMIAALAITFILFFLFKQSINIITLSGLILALGNMIDSSIVVTDIISQYQKEGYPIDEACEKGIKEVTVPILSSTITTIAVFVPLVFMSGIAGAIFTSQAFAVSAGMLVSYVTGLLLLPVLYKLSYLIGSTSSRSSNWLLVVQGKIDGVIFPFYDRGLKYCFRHRGKFYLILFLSIPMCYVLFQMLPKKTMPDVDYTESIAKIEWNENIHVEENSSRIHKILQQSGLFAKENSCYIGQQQYLLEKDNELNTNEAQLYFKTANPAQIPQLTSHLTKWFQKEYPQSSIVFSPPENVFEKIFSTGDADIIVQLNPLIPGTVPDLQNIKKTANDFFKATGVKAQVIPVEAQYEIEFDNEKLLLYGVSQQEVFQSLKSAFGNNQIAILRSYQQYLPISIYGKHQSIAQALNQTLVSARNNFGSSKVPAQLLVKMKLTQEIKSIVGRGDGEYIPLVYQHVEDPERFLKQVTSAAKNEGRWHLSFEGAHFFNTEMLKQLTGILLISVLLLYFILVSQFESFIQPLIVLIEIPIDIAFALLVLKLSGNNLNLMSGIGIIVIIGVIINDSILKIDLVNQLRLTSKLPLMEVIHIAGTRRLRSIIMTSLTSLLSMVPILFTFDMGSQLQKPLAIAMVSTMIIGTLVSIFIIPLLYWEIYRKKEATTC